MVRASSFSLIPALLSAAWAGEVTVERGPFSVVSRFEAVVTAADPLVVRPPGLLEEVIEIAPHGTRVETGALLVRFDATELEHEIAVAKDASVSASLRAERTALALRHLDESAPLKYEVLKDAARQAKEEADAFAVQGRKAAEEKAAALEDEAARERALKVIIPRQAAEISRKLKQAELALRQEEEAIRHELKVLGAEVAAAEGASKVAADRLAVLEKRRDAVEWKAPAGGWWFHGTPAGDPGFSTEARGYFIAAASPAVLVARVSAVTAGVLAAGDEGTGHPAGKVQPVVPLKIGTVTAAADAGGRWRVELSAVWPEGFQPVPGSLVEADFATQRKDSVIVVPSPALSFGAGGWTVKVKLADGKTEARPVVPGFVSGDRTEIVSGLEAGQVVIVP